MDLGQAEMGIPRRQTGRYVSNTRASLQPVDPFTLSIAQVAHSQQYPSHIDDIDNVHLPPHERSRFPRIRWQTPYGPAPSPYRVQVQRTQPHRYERSPSPVMPRLATRRPATPIAHSPYSPVLNFHQPAVLPTPPPLSGPPSGRGAPASSDSRHGSLDYPISLSPMDNAGSLINLPTPTSSVPVIDSNDQLEHLPPNQVPLPESPPQQSGYPPEHSLSQPANSVPPLPLTPSATSTRSKSSHSSADGGNNIISSHGFPQDMPYGVRPAASAAVAVKGTIGSGKLFVTDILPRQLYLHCLFRLPYFYFSRVSRIFTEADLTLEEIHEMALQVYTENKLLLNPDLFGAEPYDYPGTTTLSPAYERLKTAWEQFIDTLIKEWKTLNIISVLLLSAIMTIFQIQGAAEDPLTRYLAFWSLICALTSLLYSCSFIIQFASMHKTYKAVQWAIEVQKIHTITWNVWVMLAMPMVWMIWSILAFIASMMSFLWRSRANLPSDFEFSVSRSTELGFRIFICVALGLGVVYGILILITFWRYGSRLDDKWTRHVGTFVESAGPAPIYRPAALPTVPQSPIPATPIRTAVRRPQTFSQDIDHRFERFDHYRERFPRSEIIASPPRWGIEAPRSPKTSLWYQSPLPAPPQRKIQLARPLEIPEQQLRRSKSAPSLPLLSILDTNNKNQGPITNILPDSQDQQLHRSTSTSSRHSLRHHRLSSENNSTNLLPMPVERQLHHSASDNLIRYSLPRPSISVAKDPNNSIDSPPRTGYDFVSSTRPLPATGHEQAIDLYPHSTHRPGSSLSSDKASVVVRSRQMSVDGSSNGMELGDHPG